MDKMVELTEDMMAMVSGGVLRQINTGTSNKAVIHSSPTTAFKNTQDRLENGTTVDTIGGTVIDDASGKSFVQISYTINGRTQTGWIAASFVGMG